MDLLVYLIKNNITELLINLTDDIIVILFPLFNSYGNAIIVSYFNHKSSY